MARLIHEFNRHLPDDALLVADGGFAAHWAGLLYDYAPPRPGIRAGSRIRLDRPTGFPAASEPGSPRPSGR